MRSIRKVASKWYVNVPLTLLLLAFTTQCQNSSDSKVSDDSKHTGEDIFMATFFAYGELSKKLTTQSKKNEAYKSLSVQEQADFKNRIDLFVQYIKESDPTFFVTFKNEINSRDHIRIRKAVDDGALKVSENFEKVFPEFQPLIEEVKKDVENKAFLTDGKFDIDKVEKKQADYDRLLSNNMLSDNGGRKMACTLAIACAVYLAIAVHEYAAITVVAAVAIMTWKYIAFSTEPFAASNREKDPLQLEIMVNDLANL